MVISAMLSVICNGYQQIEHPIQAAPPAPEAVATPTASIAYKKLAEPLAEWIANYVWKVCTTGMNLPATYAQPQYVYLAASRLNHY